jgi:hypothetical protein
VPDIPVDGYIRVAYVATIANIAAPTTAELNAGTSVLLSSIITADGLVGFEASTAEVDTTALDSTFDTKSIGRDSFEGTMLRLKKQSGTDTAYSTLTRGTTGYIVIRRDVLSGTAWAAGQKVEVFPIICGRERNLSPEANTVRRYEVPTPITSAPELRATVA